MKRALSLIIVLAMVLCMVPFSAFAADGEFGFGGDWEDGTIILSEDNGYGLTFLWTASEAGTLEISATTNAEATIYILVDGDNYESAIEVDEGEQLEITIADADFVGGEVTVSADLTGLPGTESNPYKVYNPTVEGVEDQNTVTVPANTTVYCNLIYFGGNTVVASGEGVKIAYNGETYGSIEEVDGVLQLVDTAEFDVDAGLVMIDVKLSNKTESEQTYTFTQKAAEVGTMDNPEVVTDGTYAADLEAGSQGYYYSYTAEGDGTVNVSVSAADAAGNALATIMGVGNLTSYKFNDQTEASSDSIAVSTGDKLQIFVTTYNADDMWNAPAGTVTTTIAFKAPAETVELVLGDNSLLVASGATNTYTYTPEMDGVLTVAANSWDFAANIGQQFYFGNMTLNVNGNQAMGNSIETNVTAGTPVTIEMANVNMGQDVTVTLNLAIAEPAGEGESADTAIEIELPWSVTLEGEHDMYYKYTATEDCIIKVTSTGYVAIDGADYKTYDENTLYVEAAAGDVIINTYAFGDGSYDYAAEIVAALPEGNGSYNFPIVIDAVPYEAANSGETTLYYTYTAAKAGTLTFSGTEYYVTLNGGWDSALDENNQVVVAEGDVIKVSIYPENSFAVDYVPMVAMIGDVEYLTVADALAAAQSGDTVVMIADSDESSSILIINEGVTLSLVNFNLHAKYVIGLTGSKLYANYEDSAGVGADLYVSETGLILLGDVADSSRGRPLLPIWVEKTAETDVAHYIFTDVTIANVTFDNTLDDGDTVKIVFQTGWTGHVRTTYLRDGNGIGPKGLAVTVKFSWVTADGITVTQEYFYSEGLVYDYATNNSKLNASYSGVSELTDLKVWVEVVSDTGLTVASSRFPTE